MNLSSQVSSLELSQRLKELGVKQESLFDWVEIDENEWILMGRKKKEFDEIEEKYGQLDGCISAFTVAELGEMLPAYPNGLPFIFMGDRKHIALRNDDGSPIEDSWQKADTEADARAKMLIYLLEQGLIKV